MCLCLREISKRLITAFSWDRFHESTYLKLCRKTYTSQCDIGEAKKKSDDIILENLVFDEVNEKQERSKKTPAHKFRAEFTLGAAPGTVKNATPLPKSVYVFYVYILY